MNEQPAYRQAVTDAERLAALVAAVAPLLDRESVQPFYSAWEFDEGTDGEALHAALAAAYALAENAPQECVCSTCSRGRHDLCRHGDCLTPNAPVTPS